MLQLVVDRDRLPSGLRLVQGNDGKVGISEATTAPSAEARKNIVAEQIADWPARIAILLPLETGHEAFHLARREVIWDNILAENGAVRRIDRAAPDIVAYFFTVTAASHEGAEQMARELGLQVAEHFSGKLIKAMVYSEPTPLPPELHIIESDVNEPPPGA